MISETTYVDRIDRLDRGVNLGGWLALGQSYDSNSAQNFITDRDIQTIKKLGLDHVRLPINPNYFLDEARPSQIRSEYLGYLNRALDMILNQGLSVIIDLHPNNNFKIRLTKEDSFVDTVATFWKSLAKELSKRSPDQVFLEVLNEPNFEALLDSKSLGISRWNQVQQKLITAIRDGAPKHTILATGADLDSITGLTQIQLSGDPNVAYAVHFYDPFLFTHQGAAWIPTIKDFKNLPYPVNTGVTIQNLQAFGVAESDKPSADRITNYYNNRWNSQKIESKIAELSTWSRQHNVKVIADEFGVYKNNTLPSDRATWLTDVRSALDKYNIGWTMWDYAGGFGLTSGKLNGNRLVDPSVSNALGLTNVPVRS